MRESLLTVLRDEKTSVQQFRQAASQLASLLAAEAAHLVPQQPHAVKTPLGKAEGKTLHHRVILIPIVRSGMAMLPSFMNYFPQAPIGFFGMRRDETTAKPVLYYENLPALQSSDLIFILDPMVATAGSALLAIKSLIDKGANPSKIVLVSVLGSKEGIAKIKGQHPSMTIIIAAEDAELNDRKFIVPGLGDFGDRYFGNA